MDLNRGLFLSLNRLSGRWPMIDQAIYFLAEHAGWAIAGGLLVWWFAARSAAYRHRFQHVFVAGACAWLLVGVIKHVTHADRPFVALTDVNQLVFNVRTYAFPSGHAALFASLGAAVYWLHKKAGAGILAAAFFIGLARIAAGIHWPIDIAAGLALGMAVGTATMWATDRIDPPKPKS